MLVGLLLLVLPLMPFIGTEINGARIWIQLDLGSRSFSFQPAEIAKIVLIVFFAGYLVVKRDVLALARSRVMGIDLPRGRDLGPILLAWAASLAVFVFQRDLGTSLLFFGLFVAMLYIATERRSWLFIGGLLFAAGALVAYQLFDHVQLRVAIWLNPFADETGDGFQIAQSLYGFASGGVLGVGLGQGHPDFVPFAKTDFIMAAFGEELGLTGVIALLVLYAIIIERGMRTAVACRDAFGKLLAAGLSIAVGIQVFVVVGGVMKLIPLTGLTTPFLSYGGSSLVANWVLVALLLRVSDAARRPPEARREVAVMNATIRRTAVALGLLILALMINANVLAVIQNDELRARDGNRRQIIDEYDQQRGSILVGRKEVAKSVPTDERLRYLRVYSEGPDLRPRDRLLLRLRRHRHRAG